MRTRRYSTMLDSSCWNYLQTMSVVGACVTDELTWPLSGLKGEDRVGLRVHALACTVLLLGGSHRWSDEFLFANVRVGEA